jgi:hypothetical protein
MRRSLFVLSALLLLLVAAPVFALERTHAALGDRALADDWAAGTTCSVSYYNTCTGWIWIWSGWSATDVVGQVFEPCCKGGTMLAATTVYAWTGAPAGTVYGFTGTITVSAADGSGCPNGVLAQQVFLPSSGANNQLWNLPVAGSVVLTIDHPSPNGFPIPTAWVSDHPAAGPTGPAACGFCFPSTRPIHSYYYGNATTALCPGSSLDDGVCNAEWALWAASFLCTVNVEPETWAGVKNLYR